MANVNLFVAPNPSHLEFINPVVMGMVRAEQKLKKDVKKKKVMGLLVHGDAAFSGLGIVTEALQLSNLEGFDIGGVIHIVINNQVLQLSFRNEDLSVDWIHDASSVRPIRNSRN